MHVVSRSLPVSSTSWTVARPSLAPDDDYRVGEGRGSVRVDPIIIIIVSGSGLTASKLVGPPLTSTVFILIERKLKK